MLHTYREAKQAIVHPHRFTNLKRNIRMGLNSRIGHQRFHAAQALCEGDEIQAAQDRLHEPGITHLEGEDPRVAARLSALDSIARMIRQPWMKDFGDLRMSIQMLRNRQRIALMAVHTKRKGFHAAH
ncbi:hypothetical protein D3C71_1531820 [compost metagenome]